MAPSVLSGLICILPVAIIMLLATAALVFAAVMTFKKGNRSLAVILLLCSFVPLVNFLIFFVMLIIFVLESLGIM